MGKSHIEMRIPKSRFRMKYTLSYNISWSLKAAKVGVQIPYRFEFWQNDDVIKWKHFPRYWPFVWGIHRWPAAQRPVTRSFGAFFDLSLNKWLSKQSWGWWSVTPSCTLWRHCNGWFGCCVVEMLDKCTWFLGKPISIYTIWPRLEVLLF